MADNEPNPREELCERFRADLCRPTSERYYSEDDLIEIFDYAGDIEDDYLRMEALFLGARLYPDSARLAERRAIFYLFFDEKVFRAYLADHNDDASPLWDIMRLNKLPKGTPEACAAVQQFVDSMDEFEDEEIIQLVQLAETLQINGWLYDNLDLLRSRCTYLPTLLYEVAVSAENAGDYERAVRFLEELTELEPYAAEYWAMLANNQLMLERTEAAAASLDYALAIDPDYSEALRTKLGLVTETGLHGQFGTLINRLLRLDPADEGVADMALQQADEASDYEFGNAVIDLCFAGQPANTNLCHKALRFNNPQTAAYLEQTFHNGNTDRETWLGLAETAFSTGNIERVTLVFDTYQRLKGESLRHDILAYKILYHVGQYDRVVDLFMTLPGDSNLRSYENMYDAFSMFILALLRLGRIDEAAGAARNMLELFTGEPDMPGDNYRKFAMTNFLRDVLARVGEGADESDTDWFRYDPLGLDSAAI